MLLHCIIVPIIFASLLVCSLLSCRVTISFGHCFRYFRLAFSRLITINFDYGTSGQAKFCLKSKCRSNYELLYIHRNASELLPELTKLKRCCFTNIRIQLLISELYRQRLQQSFSSCGKHQEPPTIHSVCVWNFCLLTFPRCRKIYSGTIQFPPLAVSCHSPVCF